MQYQIIGEPMPVVQCQLQPGESMKTEKGSMVWMSPNMQMDTNSGGGIGKMIGRAFAGEKMFQNVYTAQGGPGMIAFGSSFVGSIRAYQVTPGKSIVCQKSSYLASEMNVELAVFFQKRLGAGFFGGEGFIMQRISGNGMVFVEIDGSAVEYDLAPGQSMLIDTGYLAVMDDTCTLDIQQVKGFKNVVFGGEGLFNTVVTGPGRILLQTMCISGFASSLVPYLPSSK